MIDSLDSLVDNLTCNLYNAKCKNWMKCKDFEKREIIRMMTLNGAKYVKLVKKLSDYCKDYNKICEDCKCYLEYMEVRKKHFIFGCEKSEKKDSNITKLPYIKISWSLNFCDKDLEKLWEKSLPSKEKFFSSLNDNGISDWNYKHVQSLECISSERYRRLYIFV